MTRVHPQRRRWWSKSKCSFQLTGIPNWSNAVGITFRLGTIRDSSRNQLEFTSRDNAREFLWFLIVHQKLPWSSGVIEIGLFRKWKFRFTQWLMKKLEVIKMLAVCCAQKRYRGKSIGKIQIWKQLAFHGVYGLLLRGHSSDSLSIYEIAQIQIKFYRWSAFGRVPLFIHAAHIPNASQIRSQFPSLLNSCD